MSQGYFVTPRQRGEPRIDTRGEAEARARKLAREGRAAKVYRISDGLNDLIYLCNPIGGQAISCKIVHGGFSGARTRRRKKRRR